MTDSIPFIPMAEASALQESVSTAPVIIEGNPPDIRGRDIATTSGSIPKPDGKKSRKVSGVVMIQDVLYAWVRNLNPPGKPMGTGSTLMVSRNLGKDWSFVEWSFPNIGYPTWLNAGQDYRAAADDYAYFIAPDGPSAYADYPDLLMGRVPVDAILDKSRYEFFHGVAENDSSTWGDYDGRRPIFSDPAGCFRPDLVFNPGLGRYLLMMSSPPVKWHWWANENPQRVCHFGLFDAPHPWGPWTTVATSKTGGCLKPVSLLIFRRSGFPMMARPSTCSTPAYRRVPTASISSGARLRSADDHLLRTWRESSATDARKE